MYRYVCVCVCACVYTCRVCMNPWKASSPCHVHHFWLHLLALCVHIWQVHWRWLCMVSPQGEWVYTIVEDLTLHCFSTSTENLELAMDAGEWVGCSLWGMCACTCTSTHTSPSPTCHTLGAHTQAHTHVRIHAHICTGTNACRSAQWENIFLCCPSLCNVSLCPSTPFRCTTIVGGVGCSVGDVCRCTIRMIVSPRAPPIPQPPGLFWGGHNWNWGRHGQHSHVVWNVGTLFGIIRVGLVRHCHHLCGFRPLVNYQSRLIYILLKGCI